MGTNTQCLHVSTLRAKLDEDESFLLVDSVCVATPPASGRNRT